MIPIPIRLVIRLDPPYDKKGRVTPVTGIKPMTTDRFIVTWTNSWKVRPKDRYFRNKSSCFRDIFKLLIRMIANRVMIIKAPMIPNSSLIMEKIKSVWGSGR